MKKLVKWISAVSVFAMMLSFCAVAFAADTKESGIYDVKENTGFTITPLLTDNSEPEVISAEISGSNVQLYKNAERVKLEFSVTDKYDYMVMLFTGGKINIETNLAYIDQITPENGKVTAYLAPGILEKGIYNVYISSFGKTGGKESAGSFKYFSAETYKIRGHVESLDASRDLTIKVYDVNNTSVPAAEKTISSSSGYSENAVNDFEIVVPKAGTYNMEIIKAGHLTARIENIVVASGTVDLTADASKPYSSVAMIPGDVNGDGSVTEEDVSVIRKPENINKDTASAASANADVNGDGTVTEIDVSIVRKPANINKSTANTTYQF